jgi:hypothetical protein
MDVRWTMLPRAARIGVIVGLAIVLPLGPFLIYAGVAVMNASAAWIEPTAGEGIAKLAGLAAFVLYLFVVFGVPAIVGGLIGARVGSTR